MKEQQRNAPPVWDPLLMFAIVTGLGLVLWLIVRKRGAPPMLTPLLAPPPLVSPWNPLP